MTRDENLNNILEIPNHYILLKYPTGYGKSRLAIERIKRKVRYSKKKVLVVIYRKAHKKNWEIEFEKWWDDYKNMIDLSFTTYAGIHNAVGYYDWVIFDECHHLSDRCQNILWRFHIPRAIFLSASINNKSILSIASMYSDIYVDEIKLRKAIDDEVLPDPIVYLMPLNLDNKNPTESIWVNKNAKGRVIECSWKDRWNYIKQRNYKVRVYCTQKQYVDDLDSKIEYWKDRYYKDRGIMSKNIWLRLCLDRLTYLSNLKTPVVKDILKHLKNYRTLTFCNSIGHTEQLGKYCINSKNKDYQDILDMFNSGKIKHITACQMLNEGMNLQNCRVGIFANLNSSETIILQRNGRLLRHKNPVIVIPYYTNTREQQIVDKMLENYNTNLIKIINFAEEIII